MKKLILHAEIEGKDLENLIQLKKDGHNVLFWNNDEYSISGTVEDVDMWGITIGNYSFGHVNGSTFAPTEIIDSIHKHSYKNKEVWVHEYINSDRHLVCQITAQGIELFTEDEKTQEQTGDLDNVFGDTYFTPSGNETSVRLMCDNPTNNVFYYTNKANKRGTLISNHKDDEIKTKASEIAEGMMKPVRDALSGVNKTKPSDLGKYEDVFSEWQEFIEILNDENVKAKNALNYASRFVCLLNESGLPFNETLTLKFKEKPFAEDWGLSEETGDYFIIIGESIRYGVSESITTELNLNTVIFPISICKAICEFVDSIGDTFSAEYG